MMIGGAENYFRSTTDQALQSVNCMGILEMRCIFTCSKSKVKIGAWKLYFIRLSFCIYYDVIPFLFWRSYCDFFALNHIITWLKLWHQMCRFHRVKIYMFGLSHCCNIHKMHGYGHLYFKECYQSKIYTKGHVISFISQKLIRRKWKNKSAQKEWLFL